MAGDEVRNVNAPGGSRQAGKTRGEPSADHKREQVRGNLKKFADALDAFARQNKAESLMLGGTETNVAQFREMLPSQWSDRLRGMFSIAQRAPEGEVRDRSLEALHAAETAREEKLVEAIRVAAAKSANGAVGMDDTLLALHAGRVQTLALVEGLGVPGFQCNGCGYLATHNNGTCPYCGSTFREVANAAEHAVRRVVEQGGNVEFLEEESALKGLGGIAALLRY
jgi:peptide subunit release factor 1 (eRF1)